MAALSSSIKKLWGFTACDYVWRNISQTENLNHNKNFEKKKIASPADFYFPSYLLFFFFGLFFSLEEAAQRPVSFY